MNLSRGGLRLAFCLSISAAGLLPAQATSTAESGVVELRVDNLPAPLGIDDAKPRFSWQLHDSARGARQTAYEVRVASTPQLASGNADVWSIGRIESGQSMNVRYGGPALKPSTRYYWSVEVWGVNGREYARGSSWFEMGLMHQDAWKGDTTAEWIGFETPEEAAVRNAPAKWVNSPEFEAVKAAKTLPQQFDYRLSFKLDKPVKRADLYAAGQDTVAAWVNGGQVLEAQPFPAWKQMPWKKFVKADVSAKLALGANVLAVETLKYTGGGEGGPGPQLAPPMIATLFVEYADGSTATFVSGTEWKTATHPGVGWEQKAFDDSGWKSAVEYSGKTIPMVSAPLGNPWIPDSVKALRRDFEVNKPVKSARLYSTALGTYEVFVNGKRVSEDLFAPGWTDYRQRVTYQTYDVTALLAQGKNAIGALLAPGWYSTPLEWYQQPNNYGATPPALRAKLRIEHTDGSVEWVATDAKWQASPSHILSSELYDGEAQDARALQVGWNTAGFVGERWKPVAAIEPKAIDVLAQEFQPIRVERAMPVVKMTEPKPGVYIYDFGQNMAAVERLRVSGPRGTDVQLRFAELLNEDGTMYVDNLRTAKATDHFILAGNGVEELQPQFTFHGFRYMEVTGLKTPPPNDAVAALAIHTNAPFSVELKTGSEMINKLWSNILWGQRSNFVGLPTDCPQRDERLGWMADAQVFWRTASYNMALAPFTRKFATDMRGTQAGTAMYGIYAPGTATENTGFGAGWSDAGVIIPWTSWLQTGDTSVIDQNWEGMTKYIAAIEKANPDWLWSKEQGIPFGDWLAPEGRTDQTLIGTAHWAWNVKLLEQMAVATGRSDEAKKYADDFEKIKAAFAKKFVKEDGTVSGADNGPNPMGERTHDNSAGIVDTQTGYVLALHMNLLPVSLRSAAADKLAAKIHANHDLLATGFLGTPYLLEELTKNGHAELAYKLLLNTDYPSWGYVIQHGGTTTWERWNSDQMKNDPGMNSYNHYAYGAVGDWIYRYAAGVDATPLDAGFHTVLLHPVFDPRLGSLDLKYESSYGRISSAWKIDGQTATWHVTIPANTTGWLEVSSSEAGKWKLDGTSLASSTLAKPVSKPGGTGFELEAGSYTFTVQL